MPALCFSVDGKHYQNGVFQKPLRHDKHVVNRNPQGCTQAFQQSGLLWTENISFRRVI